MQPRCTSLQNFTFCATADHLQSPTARLGCRFVCTTSTFAKKKDTRPVGGRGISAFSLAFLFCGGIFITGKALTFHLGLSRKNKLMKFLVMRHKTPSLIVGLLFQTCPLVSRRSLPFQKRWIMCVRHLLCILQRL